ncbi:carbohydrate-binding family 9-like protein [Chitinophaga japonensis]|uniref:Carbohydrate binding protein with CBM9 domain n=1 Tax=Chitinophaga japonensis TaxID=104662 RepID=A0A562TEY9_CHIJA|nr:carbohydrate-binding family 9-like protein [Chitinophaga japonensis]TWI91550.1 carbohydrate binding protein with CBM9 domain [Chitinophaga japonensis]
MHRFITCKSSIRPILTGWLFLFSTVTVWAQDTAPLRYTCYRSSQPPVIDGKPDEAAWSQASWTSDFVDIEGSRQPRPPLRTRVKMLWDEQYLYIAAELEEPHIWGKLLQHDTIIFHDNDFEVFIDPDGDTREYFEIEVNARNTIFDLFMPRPYSEGAHALMTWDAKGMRTAVHINGTLNQPDDKDRSWTVEMAIPFTALHLLGVPMVPGNGTVWRINFSRVEWDTDIKNGQYIKKTNPATGKPLPEHNWVWSPQGVINMHVPAKWGYLQFSTQAAAN